jgi:hypothetical protein
MDMTSPLPSQYLRFSSRGEEERKEFTGLNDLNDRTTKR